MERGNGMKNFKKIFLICFIVFFVIFILLGGVLFFLLRSFDPNKFKPQIIAQAQQALNRQVDIGNIQLSLSVRQGLIASVSGVKILDDPQFSKESFLTVDRIGLGLDVLTLITKRQINVSTVEILAPKVLLVRNEDGLFNFQTLKILQQNNQDTKNPGAPAASPADKATPAALAAILIQNIIVKDGIFSFKDYFEEEKFFDLKKLDFNLSDFSLAHPFKITVKAAAFSEKQNVSFVSSGAIDIAGASLILKNMQLRCDFSSMDTRLLTHLVPALAQAKLQNPLSGQLEVGAKEVKVNAQGLSAKELQGQVSSGEIKTGYLKTPVKNIESKFDMNNDMLNINAASCFIGNGRVDFNGTIANYLTSQDYALALKASDLNMGEILNQANQDVVLEGLASLDANVNGKGLSDLLAFEPQGGKVILRFKDGKLKNINILKIVLDKISMIPDLVSNLEQSLPEEYKKKLEQNDTEITSVNFDMNVDQGSLNIDPAEVQADVFILKGKGNMDFRLNTQMAMRILIPQDLSKSMIAAAKELKFLSNNEGQIVIPLTIQGKIPDQLTYLPDLEYLGRQLFETQGREALGNLLDKALKRKGGSNGTGTEDQTGTSGKEIINSVLDSIFK